MKPILRFTNFDNDWEEIELLKIASEISYGMNAASKEYDGENKYIRITDIDEQTNKYTHKNIVSPDGDLEEKFLVKENDILFARTGASTGKTYLYDKNDGKLYYAGFLIKANIINHNANFIFQQTKLNKYNNWVKIMSMRSGQPGINSQEYGSYKFSITSPKEENKVSNFLSLLDKKIELQSKKIEDLKLFTKKLETQYIFNSNDEYNKKRIDEIFNVKTGGDLNKSNISFIKTPLFCYPIYSNNLEMNGLYGYSDIYKIEEESITVTGRGDIGKAIKREGKYYPIVRLLVLIPKISVNLIYMQEAVNNLKLIQESTGVPQLTAPQISKYKVSYPTLDIQNKYGDILLLLQEKIRYEIRKIEKLHQQKKGLMQNMFV